MQYLEIITRILNRQNQAKVFKTKYPIREDFDRSLIPALVESHWKLKLLTLQINSKQTYEHVDSTAGIVSFDHLYSTNE